jgi:uncharacterized protein YggU (UPF0235/DUF167 family)
MISRIQVKVHPKSKIEQVRVVEGLLHIWVHEPPYENKVNDAVAKVLAKRFEVALRSVRLVKGQRSRLKMYEIEKEE